MRENYIKILIAPDLIVYAPTHKLVSDDESFANHPHVCRNKKSEKSRGDNTIIILKIRLTNLTNDTIVMSSKFVLPFELTDRFV